MVTVYLYTKPIKPKKEAHNIIYGTQSYYYYDVLYPAKITMFLVMIILCTNQYCM
jgi:hypothetical protein